MNNPNELRTLVDNILVPHSAFKSALDRAEQCFEYASVGAHEPICLALTGESRAGKTRLISTLRSRHRTVRLDDGLRIPILYANVPSRPTVANLAEVLLRGLGVEDWNRGYEATKTERLGRLMGNCQVKMLALDEFHHFYDKSSHRVQHHVADWLKNLIGETRIALIVSGLSSLHHVIDQNEQLAGRFVAPVRMPRFDWLDTGHRGQWIAILKAFTKGLSAHFDIPELGTEDFAFRLYCATGGLMGYLTKTLRQAVWNAIDANSTTINLGDLQRAHLEAVWSNERFSHLPNPFDQNNRLVPTVDLVNLSKTIGIAVIPEDKKGRTGKGKAPTAASSALVA